MNIYNWLSLAYSEPFNSLTESFYYDKRDKEFYSIHLADFFLLNEDLTLNEQIDSSYSIQTQKLIADRILRQENNDADIIAIPRLPVENRKSIMRDFIVNISDTKLLAILQQRILNQDGTQRFDFYLGEEATAEIKNDWEEFKYSQLIPHINQFLRENHIDIKASKLWDIGDNFSIQIDL